MQKRFYEIEWEKHMVWFFLSGRYKIFVCLVWFLLQGGKRKKMTQITVAMEMYGKCKKDLSHFYDEIIDD